MDVNVDEAVAEIVMALRDSFNRTEEYCGDADEEFLDALKRVMCFSIIGLLTVKKVSFEVDLVIEQCNGITLSTDTGFKDSVAKDIVTIIKAYIVT
jgi:hypothetical protein